MAEAATLADQYRQLQLKQQERFRARVAKRQVEPLQQSSAEVPSSNGGDLSDLGLLTATQERELGTTRTDSRKENKKDEGIEEDSRQVLELRERVGQLERENEGLSERLRDSEKRVAAAQRTIQAEREALGGSPATTQKIVELSKKNRVLHAELASERTRVRELEKAARVATTQQQVKTREREEEERGEGRGEEELMRRQLRCVQELLTQSKGKVSEYSNQCQQLRQELKLAQRVIAREVGEGVSVSSLLSGQGGWRGRSQQIINLRNKLSEMKGLLRKTQGGEGGVCPASSSGDGGRARAVLDKMERERRESVESVKRDMEKVQTECVELKRECHALWARNKTLTEELKSLKSNPPLGRRKAPSPSLTVSESRTLHALEVKAGKLEESNRMLRQQLMRPLHRSLQSQTHSTTTDPPPHSLPPLVDQQPRKKLRQYSQILPARQALSAGVPAAHLPREVSSLREAQMLRTLAETERDRLSELNMTLQQRLAGVEDQLVRLKTQQTNHRLPSLGRTTNSCRRHSQSTSTAAGVGSSSERLTDLETKLAIQRDENTVLRDTLSQLRREKVEEAKLFHATLQETRRMCAEMIRSNTQQNINSIS